MGVDVDADADADVKVTELVLWKEGGGGGGGGRGDKSTWMMPGPAATSASSADIVGDIDNEGCPFFLVPLDIGLGLI